MTGFLFLEGRQMLNVNCKILLVLLALGFGANDATRAVELRDIEIGTRSLKIKVGEPFVFRLTYRFEQPLVSETHQVPNGIDHYAYFVLKRSDDGSLVGRYRVDDVSLKLQDGQGSEYAENFIIFYDAGRRKLIFDKPETYVIQVEGWTKTSNSLTINVEPASKLDKRAIPLLSDPNDYKFLVDGSERFVYNRAERMSHLKAVADKCKGTLLAKWAAARLGIERAKELWEKYPDGEQFMAKYRRSEIVEPLFENSYKYLGDALELPDEIPTREEVLASIISAEIVRGDYDKAVSYANEMGEKYPHGRYGRRASDLKQQILEHKSHEMAQAPQVKLEQKQWSGLLAIIVPLVVGVFVVALVLILVLWLKKKRSSCSK